MDASNKMIRAEASSPRSGKDVLRGAGQGSRHGSCSTEYMRGREAVIAELRFQMALAECEDPCSLQELFDGS